MIFFLSCTEIDRDNILDPKNPDSKRESVILLEAFINTSHPSPYNGYALDAIEILKADYQERLITVELHRNVSDTDDNLSIPEIDILHARYTTEYTLDQGRNKGVPDIFLNGAVNRVQGSYNVTNVVSRVQKIAESLFLNQGFFSVEGDAKHTGNIVKGKYRIARLGNKSTNNMILRIYIIYNSEQVNNASGTGQNTVSAIESIPIAQINSGDFIEEPFSINVSNSQAEKIVFVLMDSADLSVLHAFEKEIL